MSVTMQFVGLVNGGGTEFDGRYLVAVDFTRPGVSPTGQPMTVHIETTDDPARAARFADIGEAFELWRGKTGRTRADGKPDRPLTAFNVLFDEGG